MQDGLLPLLIGGQIIEGIVLRGLVGDADDRRALGEREIRNVLVEIGLRGGLYAPAALAEVDGVEIPFDDLALVVLFLELQRAEDLGELALDGHFVLPGQVFDELLRDRGAAVGVRHAGEHFHERSGGAIPVDALVLVKALVLDRNEGFLHVPGDLVIIDPDALFLAGERYELFPAARGVGVPDGAGFAELIVLERDVQGGAQTAFDIVGEDTSEDQARQDKDQQDGTEDLENGAERDGDRVDRQIGGLGGHLAAVYPAQPAPEGLEVDLADLEAVLVLFIFHLSENTSRRKKDRAHSLFHLILSLYYITARQRKVAFL